MSAKPDIERKDTVDRSKPDTERKEIVDRSNVNKHHRTTTELCPASEERTAGPVDGRAGPAGEQGYRQGHKESPNLRPTHPKASADSVETVEASSAPGDQSQQRNYLAETDWQPTARPVRQRNKTRISAALGRPMSRSLPNPHYSVKYSIMRGWREIRAGARRGDSPETG